MSEFLKNKYFFSNLSIYENDDFLIFTFSDKTQFDQSKCNLVQQNAFSIRQYIKILRKKGKYPKKSNSNQKHVICFRY
jgi:hypothetical protein